MRGADGTVTWITPVLDLNGWAVQPLSLDLYGGAHGLAILLSGYLREAADGRAEPIEGLDGLGEAVLRTIRAMEDRDAARRREGMRLRPDPPGAYLGIASQVWSWLLLRSLGVVGEEALQRARALAALLPESIEADDGYDLLSGMAGAIVPLLRLGRETGEERWPRLARTIGERLAGRAERRSGGVCWPSLRFPQGLGGLAHGASGIGWALARLADSPGDHEGARELAEAAFAYEDTLYDAEQRGWLDLRNDGFAAKAWCHGAGGIGLVAADRLAREGGTVWRDRLARAAASCWADGIGWNHTLCHGDLGCWETIEQARAAGVAPVERDRLDAVILGSLETNGPVSGLARDAFAPGLLPGLGGAAYQLLRMHPECALPSVLLPDLA